LEIGCINAELKVDATSVEAVYNFVQGGLYFLGILAVIKISVDGSGV
jgi:hypothetical protein